MFLIISNVFNYFNLYYYSTTLKVEGIIFKLSFWFFPNLTIFRIYLFDLILFYIVLSMLYVHLFLFFSFHYIIFFYDQLLP